MAKDVAIINAETPNIQNQNQGLFVCLNLFIIIILGGTFPLGCFQYVIEIYCPRIKNM